MVDAAHWLEVAVSKEALALRGSAGRLAAAAAGFCRSPEPEAGRESAPAEEAACMPSHAFLISACAMGCVHRLDTPGSVHTALICWKQHVWQ